MHVQPGARSSGWVGWKDAIFHLRIHAPPREGAANAATIVFLAEQLGVAKSSLHLLRGEKSRQKTFRVDGLSATEVQARLPPAQEPSAQP
ncbi:DUF167 domain-containing protein [Acidithiobacillus sp. IBUN Pt1247-S3]|uniref:DUF167 domain-containing protein n=1 Tax=Acidithiobacillus sp. IBUN Pt1247-S3 TaxID=3166642 RepID=UPI0034E4B887